MRFTTKDKLASALVGAIVLIYAAYVAFDGIPFVQDATGMAAIGLVLGFVSRRMGGTGEFTHRRLARVGAFATMAVGIAAMVAGSELLLAVFVIGTVGSWAAAMYAHSHHQRRETRLDTTGLAAGTAGSHDLVGGLR